MEYNKKKLENWNAYKISKILFLFFALFVYACNFCGKLNSEQQKKVDLAAQKYKDVLRIEVIPCESSYINVYLETEAYNDSMFNDLHKILYDKMKKEGWPTLIIIDSQNKYLYSHSYTNKVYKQTGD